MIIFEGRSSLSVGRRRSDFVATATRPTVATSNSNGGRIVNRHFIVGLGNAEWAFEMFSLATTDLVIDVSGYFAP